MRLPSRGLFAGALPIRIYRFSFLIQFCALSIGFSEWRVTRPKPNFAELDAGSGTRRGAISDANDNVLYHSLLEFAGRMEAAQVAIPQEQLSSLLVISARNGDFGKGNDAQEHASHCKPN
jgi:hypothetical protein